MDEHKMPKSVLLALYRTFDTFDEGITESKLKFYGMENVANNVISCLHGKKNSKFNINPISRIR